MCEILEKVQNKGHEEGREVGGLEKAREVVLNLNQMGMSKEEISCIAGVALETVERWLDEA